MVFGIHNINRSGKSERTALINAIDVRAHLLILS